MALLTVRANIFSFLQARVEALKRRVLTSWRTYKGPSRPTPSSVQPDANGPQTKNNSNLPPEVNFNEELCVEDLEKSKSSELNGFVNKWKEKALHSEQGAPGYRRSSMV